MPLHYYNLLNEINAFVKKNNNFLTFTDGGCTREMKSMHRGKHHISITFQTHLSATSVSVRASDGANRFKLYVLNKSFFKLLILNYALSCCTSQYPHCFFSKDILSGC